MAATVPATGVTAMNEPSPAPTLDTASAVNTPTANEDKKSATDQIKMLLREVVATESKYTRDLEMTVKHFYNPILQTWSTPSKETPDLASLLSTLPQLLEIHTELLVQLQRTRSPETLDIDGSRLALVLSNSATSFQQIYVAFCGQRLAALDAVNALRRKSPPFAKFLDEASAKCDNQTLDSLLSKPVQRICRYPLLLQQIIKHAPAEGPNHKGYTQALDTMSSVAALVDKASAKLASDTKLQIFDTTIAKLPAPLHDAKRILLFEKQSLATWSTKKSPKAETICLVLLLTDTIVLVGCKKKDALRHKMSLKSAEITATHWTDDQGRFVMDFRSGKTWLTIYEPELYEKENWLRFLPQAGLALGPRTPTKLHHSLSASSGNLAELKSVGFAQQRGRTQMRNSQLINSPLHSARKGGSKPHSGSSSVTADPGVAAPDSAAELEEGELPQLKNFSNTFSRSNSSIYLQKLRYNSMPPISRLSLVRDDSSIKTSVSPRTKLPPTATDDLSSNETEVTLPDLLPRGRSRGRSQSRPRRSRSPSPNDEPVRRAPRSRSKTRRDSRITSNATPPQKVHSLVLPQLPSPEITSSLDTSESGEFPHLDSSEEDSFKDPHRSTSKGVSSVSLGSLPSTARSLPGRYEPPTSSKGLEGGSLKRSSQSEMSRSESSEALIMSLRSEVTSLRHKVTKLETTQAELMTQLSMVIPLLQLAATSLNTLAAGHAITPADPVPK